MREKLPVWLAERGVDRDILLLEQTGQTCRAEARIKRPENRSGHYHQYRYGN